MEYEQSCTKIILAFILTLLSLILYTYRRNANYYKYAAQLPGPPALPILGNILYFLDTKIADLPMTVLRLSAKYGDTMRLWLGTRLFIFISDPEDLEIALRSPKLAHKEEYTHKFIATALGTGLVTSSGILKTFVYDFFTQTDILVQRLRKEENKPINIQLFLSACTLDFISTSMFDASLEAQLGKRDKDIIEAGKRLEYLVVQRAFTLWQHPDFIYRQTKAGQEMKEKYDLIKKTARDVILARKKQEREQPKGQNRISFIDLMVSTPEEIMSDDEFLDEIITIINAERVYKEIKELADGLMGEKPNADELEELKYTEMAIKETLRLFPTITVISRKATDDVTLATCKIPKGASVGINFYHTFHNPKYWEKPEEYNPDRFLPEEEAKRHPYLYTPFSSGSRVCIGKAYAMFSMKSIAYAILKEFRIHTDMKMADIEINMIVLLLFSKNNKIRLERRN